MTTYVVTPAVSLMPVAPRNDAAGNSPRHETADGRGWRGPECELLLGHYAELFELAVTVPRRFSTAPTLASRPNSRPTWATRSVGSSSPSSTLVFDDWPGLNVVESAAPVETVGEKATATVVTGRAVPPPMVVANPALRRKRSYSLPVDLHQRMHAYERRYLADKRERLAQGAFLCDVLARLPGDEPGIEELLDAAEGRDSRLLVRPINAAVPDEIHTWPSPTCPTGETSGCPLTGSPPSSSTATSAPSKRGRSNHPTPERRLAFWLSRALAAESPARVLG